MADEQKNVNQVQIKVDDETLKGKYANAMQVSHTKEEFILDFMNLFPPQGVVTARVITSPGHAKRVMRALEENISKYEDVFGEIVESESLPEVKYSVN